MPDNSIFGGTMALTHKAMDLRLARQGLIQSNIANIQTPGYMAQDLPFARVMESITSGGGGLVRTHEKHMQVDPVMNAMSETANIEKGPVDLDEQMLNLSENNLMYQVATRIMTKKFEGLRFAIDEGGK